MFQQIWHPGEEPHYIKETRLQGDALHARRGLYDTSHIASDRSLAEHERILGFDGGELPTEGTVLVIGSGLSRRFERELSQKREDIFVCSIDPHLRHGVQERLRETVRFEGLPGENLWDDRGRDLKRRLVGHWEYEDREAPWANNVNFPWEFHGQPYYRLGAVASALYDSEEAGTHNLPLRNDSADCVLGLFAVPHTTAAPHEKSTANAPLLFRETLRILKPGGLARLYPFVWDDLVEIERANRDLPVATGTLLNNTDEVSGSVQLPGNPEPVTARLRIEQVDPQRASVYSRLVIEKAPSAQAA